MYDDPFAKGFLGATLSRVSTVGKLCLGLFLAALWLLVVPAPSMAATVTVGGTVTAATEKNIVEDTMTITITLEGNQWATDVASLEAKRNLLFDSLIGESEASEWVKVVTALKTTGAGAIDRNADNVKVTITLPATADYSITANQTITVNVPASLLLDSGNPVISPGSFTITANRAAAITGTITTATESNIVSGGQTIIITLTNDTWVADVITNATKRDILIDCFLAAPEADQWNKVIAVMKGQADPASFMSLNADETALTITLPATSGYDISDPQTITANLPADLLKRSIALVEAAPTFTINPIRTTSVLSGTVVSEPPVEDDIKKVGGKTIIITLGGNQWATDVASAEAKRNLLFESLTTAGSESSEWAKVVTALKTAGESGIIRNANNVEITITLPNTPGYSITANQTITVNVPASLLLDSGNPVTSPGSFTISANRAAAITGTITEAPTESDIATGGKTIIITLTNETWVSDVASNTTRRDQLFNALEAGTEIPEWAKVIDTMKAQANPATVVTRTSNTVVTITLPAIASYDIASTQTITANLPVELLASNKLLVDPAPSFTIGPARTTAVLSGNFIDTPTEANVQAGAGTGAKTIIITLGGNQWADDVDSLEAKRDLLFDSLIAGSESGEWAKVVTALKNDGTVTRTSNTVITITLPAVADYNITADQKIILSIPSTLLSDANSPITSTLSFTISASIAATISGTILGNTSEADIVAGGKTIIITLTNDTWVADVVSNTSKRDALLDGLVATTGDAAQWTNVVNALKAAPDLGSVITRNSDTVVTITLPVSYGYNISSNQEVTLTIAKDLTVNPGADLVAIPKFTITPATPTAALGGTVTEATSEQAMLTGGKTIIITLTDDIWASDLVTNPDKRNALFEGLVAGPEEEKDEWDNHVVATLKTAANSDPANVLARNSDTVVTITLPAVVGYNIAKNQVVSLTISKDLLTVADGDISVLPNFTVIAVTPTATLTGSLLTGATEPNILAGGKTIIITLTDDIWASDVVTDKAKREVLFNGLAAGTEVDEWAKVVAELKAAALINPAKVIARTSDNVVTITLPATAGYNIAADQVITFNIPASVLVSASAEVTASPTITIAPVTAVLTGTAIASPVGMNDIITGGKTIVITLANDTWVSDIASNTAKRNDLIDGFLAAGTEGAEWGKVITALKNSSASVVRTSNNVVTIILPVTPDYNITADQTITLTIPSTALSSGGGEVSASPAFTIQLSTAVAASISGTVISAPPTEADIIAGGRTIIITLTNDTWATDVASNTTKRTALFNALTSATESKEWKKVITALRASPIALLRNSDTEVTITLPACSGYNIAADQVVSLTIPRTVLTSATANVIASNTFKIVAVNPTAKIDISDPIGTVTTTTTETHIFDGGSTIIITLTGDTWASDVASNATKRNALLSGMVASTEDKEWKKVITAIKADSSAVRRASDTIVTITLPAVNTYNITADQEVTLSIPASAMTLGSSTVVAEPSLTIFEQSAGTTLVGTMITETITAADIVNGGKDIVILLTNNTWVSDVASTKTKRDALINGLVTASTDSSQWAKVITALKANPNNVQRVTNYQVTITLPPTPGYAISSDEIVRLTIPKTLLGINTSDMTGNRELTIKPAGTAVLGGTMITDSLAEADIIAGGKTLTVTLSNDTWVADISSDDDLRKALFAGLTANNQTSEWAKVVTALQNAATAITRDSDTVVTITLPAVAGYSITDQQIITLTIPESALILTRADVQAAPNLSIRVQMGDLLANDAKLAQLLSNYSLRQIQVTVPPKYINKVQVNHFPIDTKYITSIDVLCESNVARVAATTAGPVTHETTRYILSSGKRLFNIGFSGLTAPGDISLTIYDSYGAQPQAPITVQYVEGLSNPVQAPASDLRGTYTLYELSSNTTLFNSILGAYELNELIISTITE